MIRPNKELVEKWGPVLFAEGVQKIGDSQRVATTAILLENQERAILEERSSGNELLSETNYASGGTNIANWDPILISMVRRAAPNLLAFDIASVQPMNSPVGLVFAMKSRYVTTKGTLSTSSPEALGTSEPLTGFSGDKAAQAGDPSALPTALNVYDADGSPSTWTNADDATLNGVGDTSLTGHGLTTAQGELLTSTSNYGDATYMNEMGFTIEKTSVTAKTRALRAEYSVELAQDLRALHNLDAETELANIISTTILADINREIIRTVNTKAKLGAQQAGLYGKSNGGPGGAFDLKVDADGRWSVEKFKGLLVQIQREANGIAKDTRLGRGNFVLCSSDVAAALSASGLLDYAPAMSTRLDIDDTGNLFAGVINGWLKVFIDPYAGLDYITVGYRGSNPYDAGMFYCPYVPLTPYKSVHAETMQPVIAFKTRYGMIANPFSESTVAATNGLGTDRSNNYYRIFKVTNLLVA